VVYGVGGWRPTVYGVGGWRPTGGKGDNDVYVTNDIYITNDMNYIDYVIESRELPAS
jgi:hypothetical protein